MELERRYKELSRAKVEDGVGLEGAIKIRSPRAHRLSSPRTATFAHNTLMT
jgi:hypothetical protein